MTLRMFVIWSSLILNLLTLSPSRVCAANSPPITLLREATTQAAYLEDYESRRSVILSIMNAQLTLGDEVGAAITAELESIPPNRDYLLVSVVAMQADKGDIIGAERTLAGITQTLARANAVAFIAPAYAARGNILKALQLAEEIPDNYAAHVDVMSRIAAEQAKAGDVRGALHTVRQTWQRHPYALIPIIQSQMRAEFFHPASEFRDLTDDPYLRSYLLWAFSRNAKERHQRIDIAARIPQGHAKALAFKEIAESQLTEGDLVGCLSSLGTATEAAKATLNRYTRADIQWRIAVLFARARDILQARTVAMGIEEAGHREAAVREIVEIQARNQDYEGALQTALLGTGGESSTDYALSRIAAQQAALAMLNDAMETLAHIQKDEARGNGPAAAAAAAGEAGQFGTALRLMQIYRQWIDSPRQLSRHSDTGQESDFPHGQPENWAMDLPAWRRFMTYTLRCMAVAHADRNALEEALGYALIISDPAESGRTLGEIAFKQARRGDVEGALRWIERAELPAHKAFALSEVARALMDPNEN